MQQLLLLFDIELPHMVMVMQRPLCEKAGTSTMYVNFHILLFSAACMRVVVVTAGGAFIMHC